MKKKAKTTEYCVQVFCRRCGGHITYVMSPKAKHREGSHETWERCVSGLESRISRLEREEERRDRNEWL